MRILARNSKVALGVFESKKQSDFLFFRKTFRIFEYGMDRYDHPLMGDNSLFYPILSPENFKNYADEESYIRILVRDRKRKKWIWVGNLSLDEKRSQKVIYLNIFVRKPWRKKHFAAEAIRLYLRKAKKKMWCKKVGASVWPGNTASLRLFRSLEDFNELGVLKKGRSGWADKGAIYFESQIK